MTVMFPDLDRGYMVNTYTNFNRFQTFIECVLERKTAGGQPQYSYLSSRCRPEDISPKSIFNGLMYYFGVVSSDWDGTYGIYMGSTLCSRNFLKPSGQVAEKPQLPSHVECALRPVQVLSFDEALADFQKIGPDKDNKIFLAVRWKEGEFEYTLYTPCRYTNYPNPDKNHADLWNERPNYPRHELRYLQPISGVVITEVEGRIQLAFVAAHITAGGAQRVEFCLRDCTSFFRLRNPRGLRGYLTRLIAKSWIGRYFSISEFWRVVPVSGEGFFYRYL